VRGIPGQLAVQTRRVFLGGSLLALGGCGTPPAGGPSSWDVWAWRENQNLPYAFVPVTAEVVAVLAKIKPRLATAFTDRRPPSTLRFGIGDILSVTIFEASSGGLFIPSEAGVRPGNFITIPSQAVDVNGNVSIPYAGAIRARGRTQVELQQAIVDALKNRAIEPQVVVSVVEQRTSLITVLGDVQRPSRLPAQSAGERLLETIARAGGPAAAGFAGSGSGQDLWVILEREGRRAIAPFGALIYEPVNNIWAHPDDIIFLYREPQTFLAFGAMGSQQQFPFGAWRLSVAEALAKAGGLSDAQADPAAVFLYRGETREVAEALGIDCSRFEGPLIPVIYNFNFRGASGYFLATTFEMRNKDVMFASNSVSVEQTKFMTYIRTINGTIADPLNTAIITVALRNLLAGTTVGTSILTTPTPVVPTTP
jgi:polysaccharide export outer membrane protein